MNVNAEHWLDGVRRCPSPNFDSRPLGEISLLVVHGISLPPGQFGGGLVDALFCNTLDGAGDPSDPAADPASDRALAELADLRVSSHILVERDGRITQYVPFDQRAWHAGVSAWQGRAGCNDFSIGVELEGCDDVAYCDVQYDALLALTGALMKRYPALELTRITGHQDIAPGRKTDPGEAFDWRRFLVGVAAAARNRCVAHRH